ncbi:hypothetical protein [Hespellia stercorisuis]|uniref:hypothetical protein n=1 Tax=Hespellia stercorisuis TaxID=180311 RepID=UPI0013566FA7|nr:hypothetical protein [Hespellia stercorisuis]
MLAGRCVPDAQAAKAFAGVNHADGIKTAGGNSEEKRETTASPGEEEKWIMSKHL